MRAVAGGIVLAVGAAVALGWAVAGLWPGRTVEAAIVGFAFGMAFMAWVWPPLAETGLSREPPVLRALGRAAPGCPAVGHALDGALGPRFTGRLMCWRPEGHRWHHYDKARQVYWSNE